MAESPSLLLEAVAEVARRAGDVALGHFRSGLAVEVKSDGSPVTAADRAAEQTARDWIAARFPADAVLGEEYGGGAPGAPGASGAAGPGRRWIVDPIDGTKTFVRGVPLWGTLVAVAEGETVLAGAAYFPALSELLSAAVGCGCWWNGARAHVSAVASLDSATVLTTDEQFGGRLPYREAWRRLAARVALARSWGDCYGYLLVATGRAEVMTDGVMAPWDAAALQPVITEAGGVLTDWKGRPTPFGGSTIATNAALADAVRQTLRLD